MNDFVKELCLGNTRRSLRNGLKSGFAVLNRGDATITHAGNRLKRSVLVRFYSPADWESINYIAGKYPDLVPLYDEIYNKHNRSYFEALEVKAEKMAKKYDCAFVDSVS